MTIIIYCLLCSLFVNFVQNFLQFFMSIVKVILKLRHLIVSEVLVECFRLYWLKLHVFNLSSSPAAIQAFSKPLFLFHLMQLVIVNRVNFLARASKQADVI